MKVSQYSESHCLAKLADFSSYCEIYICAPQCGDVTSLADACRLSDPSTYVEGVSHIQVRLEEDFLLSGQIA